MERATELRHLPPDLRHIISNYLEENDCWKRLMRIVPKNVDCYEEKKYTKEQENLIATPRHGDSRQSAEIFLEEWATSGRKEQRPTLGTLLDNLVRAELFFVADYVAGILNEPPPQRPDNGPGALIEIKLPSGLINGVASYVDDSSCYPNTEDINVNAIVLNGIPEINQDFYTKYRHNDKKSYGCIEMVSKPVTLANQNSERLHRQKQEHSNLNSSQVLNSSLTLTKIVNGTLSDAQQTETPHQTKQGLLNSPLTANGITEATEANSTPSLPLVSMLLSDPKSENDITCIESGAPLPLLSAFLPPMSNTENLPAISALNLDGHTTENSVDKHEPNLPSNINFDEDDLNCIDEDEDSLRNFENSNNDSSLTNVTGTSGDNSFELSSSSTSNENIPLNVLNFSR